MWQGQAGVDPLSLAPATIDQERLLQQLQHQAQTIQSGFDQQIQQAIRQRWSSATPMVDAKGVRALNLIVR